MPEVTVEGVAADGSVVTGEVTCSRDVERFLTGRPFRTEYPVEVDDVPESILVIPLLAHVCPVAWATGADVHVPVIDREFARALEDVGAALAEMHSEFMQGGTVRPDRVVDQDGGSFDRSGLLFSGGVDSLASYIRHREEDMDLLSVRGWVIDAEEREDEEWQQTRARLERFATERGHDHLAIESNMLQFLDTPMLQSHYKQYLIGSWYSSVGHGLGLLGLAAPLTYARDIGQLYIAATYPEWEVLQGGSHPDVDNNVRWTNVEASHDAHDLSRQEKFGVIADYVRDGHPDLEIRTCTSTSTGNCNRCEKCVRSMFGLLLEGLDPNDHGFQFTPETFDHARSRIETRSWTFGPHEVHMWEDLRSHYRGQDLPEGGAAFFEWLRTVDLEAVARDSNYPLNERLQRAVARNLPTPVYSRLYPVYDYLKRQRG